MSTIATAIGLTAAVCTTAANFPRLTKASLCRLRFLSKGRRHHLCEWRVSWFFDLETSDFVRTDSPEIARRQMFVVKDANGKSHYVGWPEWSHSQSTLVKAFGYQVRHLAVSTLLFSRPKSRQSSMRAPVVEKAPAKSGCSFSSNLPVSASHTIRCITTKAVGNGMGDPPLVNPRLVINYHRALTCHHETRRRVRQRRS